VDEKDNWNSFRNFGWNYLFYRDYFMRITKVYYVNRYDIGRAYGGPEEGGWWYNYGIFDRCEAMFTTRREAEAARDRLNFEAEKSNGDLNSVNCGEVIFFNVETNQGQDWPQERPHYE